MRIIKRRLLPLLLLLLLLTACGAAADDAPDAPQEDGPYTCTISISCAALLDHMDALEDSKRQLVPADGVLLPETQAAFADGDSVFDILQRVCRDNGLHMESSFTPVYNSAYVEGIGNLYEFDGGSLSGWMYAVNDFFPNYGCSQYLPDRKSVV